jgi:hypothetical protein
VLAACYRQLQRLVHLFRGEWTMELLAVLGQYLLLTFVLPGFCYLLAFGLCFVDDLTELTAKLPTSGGTRKDISKGAWFAFLGIIGGLLLSSVTFAIEIFLRQFDFFGKDWFPAIDFGEIPDIADHSLANLFTAMAFMHFNIAVGTLIIVIGRLLYAGCRAFCGKTRVWIACSLVIVVIANIMVTSHLFRRVDCMARTKDTSVSVPDCMSKSAEERRNLHSPRRSIAPNV